MNDFENPSLDSEDDYQSEFQPADWIEDLLQHLGMNGK